MAQQVTKLAAVEAECLNRVVQRTAVWSRVDPEHLAELCALEEIGLLVLTSSFADPPAEALEGFSSSVLSTIWNDAIRITKPPVLRHQMQLEMQQLHGRSTGLRRR